MQKPLKPLAAAAFAVAAFAFTNAAAMAQTGAMATDAGPGKAGMMHPQHNGYDHRHRQGQA